MTGIYDSTIPRLLAISKDAYMTGVYPICSEVKFIDRDTHWYTCRVNETIHLRLCANNINKDSGIEISQAWMSKFKMHKNRKMVQQQTAEGTATHWNSRTVGGLKCTSHS